MVSLPPLPRWPARAAVAALLLGAALLLSRCRTDAPPQPEPAAPAALQADGSLLLERTAPQHTAKPPHQLPKGSRLERRMQITAKPKAAPVVSAGGQLESAPVTVDLSLVRLSDDTRRVVASSPDGEIVGGLDIPGEPGPQAPEPKRWAVGVYVNPVLPEERGVWVDRDLGRVRLGAELGASPGRQLEARVKIGLTF